MDNKELISISNLGDRILVCDLSINDAQHEVAIGKLKDFVKTCEVPVVGAGNIKRMEDVKKLIYAGCKMAALDLSKTSVDLLKEVSLKFNKEKIVICLDSVEEYVNNKENIEKYANALICPEKIVEQIKTQTDLEVFLMGESETMNIKALTSNIAWNEFKVGDDGLVPVIVQDYKTDEVLMLAYMNEEAFDTTLKTGKMTYFSRSRNEQWIKGETSGHFQYVKGLTIDCDKDTILAKVLQIGVACHTGARSCFFNDLIKAEFDEANPVNVFNDVFAVIKDRKENPKEGSYTNYLFDKGVDKILKKIGEECTEIVIAAKNPNNEEIKYEISDFLYHVMVLMAEKGVTWEEITEELAHRA